MEQKWKLVAIMVISQTLGVNNFYSSKDQLCKIFDIRKIEEEIGSYKNNLEMNCNSQQTI